jgi:tetratricopeptide (TPR) repeat protein
VTALPSSDAIAGLRDAARQLLHHSPEERESLALRLARASRTMGRRLTGPEGARVSIAFATALSELFGESDEAMASLERAFACDPDMDDYELLVAHVSVLGQAPQALDRVAAMVSTADHALSNVGVPALHLLAAIGSAMGDETLRARCSVAAALRDPHDDALVIEADTAARAVPDLAMRLASAIPPTRRAAALEAAARAYVANDRYAEAAALFERAADLLTDQARARVERELRAALDAAGRTTEIEARAHREAVSGSGTPSIRADGWTEVAELREARGDKVGAVNALLEACRLDPEPLERWSALERVAEIAGDDDARIAALQRIETRVGTDGMPTVLKRLARAHERRGNLETAEQTWRRVLTLDADDDEANQAIQSIIVARGDYGELVDHMALRVERLSGDPEKREILRALRLRRAAILEQRLGRVDDACSELQLLLRDWPDSVGALRYLADLLDRQRDFARSVPLWRRAAELEENPAESSEMALRAASASREALGLRAEAARALGADADLGDALDAMATFEASLSKRAELLFESAQAAVRAGDLARGLDRAKRAAAAEAGPRRAALQLLAHLLEYRIRGAGAPDEARQTIHELGQTLEPLTPDDLALRAFLLAEALDVVQGGGAGLRELEGARAVVGDHPVVALGLAERFTAQGQDSLAVEAYRAALKGRLVELRRPGVVALAGADAALRAGSTEDMNYFLEVAETYEDACAGAAARRERLTAASESVGRMRAAHAGTNVAPSEEVREVRIFELEAAVHLAKDPVERASARLALARGRLDFGDARGAEPLLWEALADGLTEAGDLLAPLIAATPARSAELVRVRLQLVALQPGDFGRLEALRAAALADEDRVHARAVEHVMRAFDPGAGPLPPPPLAAQPEQPGIVALLMRPAMDASGEALALLWEGAMQLFVREAGAYGITGIERVVPGPTSPLGRLYDIAVRVLGVPRIPFFLTRSAGGPLESHVALLSPPSVILSGDVREETTALRYEFGRGIASALPHNVLRSALPRGEGRMVVDALRTAFGPPELGCQADARVARLAESFWQIIPARGQRRLQELLRAASSADYGELVERTLHSARRVGMFLAGDFGWAARALLAEAPSRVEDLPSVDNLRDLCAGVPALADLLYLAVRPEYADARWHTVASASQRRTASSGRFSLF